jgi:putative MFS transporter
MYLQGLQAQGESGWFSRTCGLGGLSRAQKVGILICSLANTVDAVEVMSLSYVLPILQGNTPHWIPAALSAAVFGGMLIGGLAGGIVCDTFGRRFVLIASMSLNAIFTLAFAATTQAHAMVAIRLFTGVFVCV